MICLHCRKEIPADSHFCSYCGRSVHGPRNTGRILRSVVGIFMANIILLTLLFWGYSEAAKSGWLDFFLLLAALVVITTRILAFRKVRRLARANVRGWALFALLLPVTSLMLLPFQE